MSRIPGMMLTVLLCVAMSSQGWAQSDSSSSASSSFSSTALPDEPSQVAAKANTPLRDYPPDAMAYTAGAFCGSGASTSTAGIKPTFGCGAGLSFAPYPVFVELGVMGPQANRSNYSGYVSLDGHIPLARTTTTYLPIAIVGYSRLFETGHALDYGISLAMPRWGKDKADIDKSMRIELRDYWTFANPSQHNVMLRVGWMVTMSDD